MIIAGRDFETKELNLTRKLCEEKKNNKYRFKTKKIVTCFDIAFNQTFINFV